MPVPHHHWHALDKLSHLLHRKERERRRPETRFKPPANARNVFEVTESEIELEEDEELETEDWHHVVHAVAELQRQREAFDEAMAFIDLEHQVKEAMSLIRAINAAYGWEPGEPAVVDRMFGTNTQAALAAALDRGSIDFRTHVMINAIRSVGRNTETGRSKLAMVAAVRNLVGGLTSSEAKLMSDAKRLGNDEFVTMVHDADKLSMAKAATEAHHIGPHTHHHLENGAGVSIADGRTRSLHEEQ